MTERAGCDARAVGIVFLDRVSFVIEGDFAPFVVQAVRIELYFGRLVFAFFGNLLRHRRARASGQN